MKLAICVADLRGVSEPVLAAACKAYRTSADPNLRFFSLGALMGLIAEEAREMRYDMRPRLVRAPEPLQLEGHKQAPTLAMGDFGGLVKLLERPQDGHPLAIGPRSAAEIEALAERRRAALERHMEEPAIGLMERKIMNDG